MTTKTLLEQEESFTLTKEELINLVDSDMSVKNGSGSFKGKLKIAITERGDGILSEIKFLTYFKDIKEKVSGAFIEGCDFILEKDATVKRPTEDEIELTSWISAKTYNLPKMTVGEFLNSSHSINFETVDGSHITLSKEEETTKIITVKRRPTEKKLKQDIAEALENEVGCLIYKHEDGRILDTIILNEVQQKDVLSETPYANNEILNTFKKEDIQAVDIAIRTGTPTLLVGHTGLGKTTLVKEIANSLNRNLVRFSVHSGITADEVIGKWLAIGGQSVWQDGILTKAVRNGDIIVIDEINACPADVLFALHPLLDDDKHIILAEKDGEIIKAHNDFRFFATMNPQDDYAGTKELNMAFLSRFNAVIHISNYPAHVEKQILERKGVHSKTAEYLVNLATNLRNFQEKQDIAWFCGTRDIINTGLLMKEGLDKEVALRVGLLNKMNSDDQAFVVDNLSLKLTPQKTEEQKRFEALQKDYEKTIAELTEQKSQLIVLQGEHEKLKKQQTAGGIELNPETIKALKLLGVMPKTTTPEKDVTVTTNTDFVPF